MILFNLNIVITIRVFIFAVKVLVQILCKFVSFSPFYLKYILQVIYLFIETVTHIFSFVLL
jgi:hypothetical protein